MATGRKVRLDLEQLEERAVPATLGIIVPAYFYPSGNSYWSQLATAAASVPLVAVMNPNNGPGTVRDPNYAAAVQQVQAAGGKVYGYVYTDYGSRSLTQVKADINHYFNWYHVDGIFVDQMTNDVNSTHQQYYAQIDHFVHHKEASWIDVGNPGSNTPRSYVGHAADELVLFENDGSGYSTYKPPAYQKDYPAGDFANILYNVASASTMQSDVNLAVSRNTGWIYVTDDTLPNPYDTLPSYWDQEVSAVAAVNG